VDTLGPVGWRDQQIRDHRATVLTGRGKREETLCEGLPTFSSRNARGLYLAITQSAAAPCTCMLEPGITGSGDAWDGACDMGIWMPIWVLIVEFIVVAVAGVFAVVKTIYQRGWNAGAQSVREELVRQRQDKARVEALKESVKTAAKSTQQVKVLLPRKVAPPRRPQTADPRVFAPPPYRREQPPAVPRKLTSVAPARRAGDRPTGRIGGPPARPPNPGAFPRGF
jgi:hypothetical protein